MEALLTRIFERLDRPPVEPNFEEITDPKTGAATVGYFAAGQWRPLYVGLATCHHFPSVAVYSAKARAEVLRSIITEVQSALPVLTINGRIA